jgi:hypothetical protein
MSFSFGQSFPFGTSCSPSFILILLTKNAINSYNPLNLFGLMIYLDLLNLMDVIFQTQGSMLPLSFFFCFLRGLFWGKIDSRFLSDKKLWGRGPIYGQHQSPDSMRLLGRSTPTSWLPLCSRMSPKETYRRIIQLNSA